MRCFIGSILGEDDQRTIEKLKPDLSDQLVRWVKPSKYHLTLEFLGDDVEREDLARHWQTVANWTPAFPITCTKVSFGGFPTRRHARIFVLFVDSEGRLEALRPEQRSFLPHITLGYARRKPIDIPDWQTVARITIPAPSLIESRQGQYKKLESAAR